MSRMAIGLRTRVVDAVERVTARAADADELLEGVATEIGKAVPYDGAMWFGLDPTTLLAVSPARMEHLDDGYCSTFWFGEFHEQDANLFADLARGGASAATLRSATSDRPMRSARYRDFLQPQGYDDELRVVFRTAGKSWGVGGLFREPGRARSTPTMSRSWKPSRRSWQQRSAPMRRGRRPRPGSRTHRG